VRGYEAEYVNGLWLMQTSALCGLAGRSAGARCRLARVLSA
jgi:hypothetical protein